MTDYWKPPEDHGWTQPTGWGHLGSTGSWPHAQNDAWRMITLEAGVNRLEGRVNTLEKRVESLDTSLGCLTFLFILVPVVSSVVWSTFWPEHWRAFWVAIAHAIVVAGS